MKPTKETSKQILLSSDLVIEAAGDNAPPGFSMVAYSGGEMKPEGFGLPVVVDLAGMIVASQNIPVRLDHERVRGVGHTTRVAVDNGQLIASGVISRDTSWARDVANSARNGFPWKASIAASVEELEEIQAGAQVRVNGQTFSGPLYVVRLSNLTEISFVDSGADPRAMARVAAHEKETAMEREQAAVTEGTVDNEDRKTLEASDDTSVALTAEKVTADIRAAAAREVNRIAAIKKHTKGFPGIEAQAIGENWDESRAELEVLRASRPQVPAVIVAPTEMNPKVLEAAALSSVGISADTLIKKYGQEVLEAADKRYRGRLGLQQMLLEAAWKNGYTGYSFRADVEGVLRAAFSTNELSGILTSATTAFLLEAFNAVDQSWRRIAATRPVSNFLATTAYRMTGLTTFEQVAPDGELKHATVDELEYANKADTYGVIFSVTRQDLINDELGALAAAPRRLGRAAALGLNKVFWTAFLNNSTFFTVGNGNYSSGAATALSIDSLTAAELMFLEQTDPDGHPLGVMPATLLVPPGLGVAASQLMNSLQVNEAAVADSATRVQVPSANPHAGKFAVAVSPYLSNALYTGYSALAWYLLANPADLAVIEACFLNGVQNPTVESADADFNVLGVQFRSYFDFGVALQEYRAGVKMKGEA